MSKVEMTYSLAMTAAQDAGNRSMREGKRTNAACQTFEKLWPAPAQQPLGTQRSKANEYND